MLVLKPKSTRARSKNQSNTRVQYFNFYHTYITCNRNFRRNLLKSSVKVNVDYKELKTSVQSGNKHLNKQLQEK